jgi:hypothetical protein
MSWSQLVQKAEFKDQERKKEIQKENFKKKNRTLLEYLWATFPFERVECQKYKARTLSDDNKNLVAYLQKSNPKTCFEFATAMVKYEESRAQVENSFMFLASTTWGICKEYLGHFKKNSTESNYLASRVGTWTIYELQQLNPKTFSTIEIISMRQVLEDLDEHF